ncbi:MAG TPA: hypothetical protein VK866_05210 [Acidimicrobiales bacterium]|nr:hypothetical protein [Acidimicrobiales bacterium]
MLDWVRLIHAMLAAGVMFLTGMFVGVWPLAIVAAYAGGRVAADIDLESRGLSVGRTVPTVAEARARARRRAGVPEVIDLRDAVVDRSTARERCARTV